MRKKLFLLLSAIFVFALISRGQNQIKIIKAGSVIDVVSGTVLKNQIILINNDTIAGIGPSLPIPANAEIIDLSQATLLPGLIDCHTHITSESGDDYYAEIFRKTPVDIAITAHIYAKKTLEAGFTTCRDLGSAAFIDVSLRNAINEGKIEGPRLLVATMFIGSTGSHGDLNGFSPYLDWIEPKYMSGVANGAEGVREQVRYNIKYGADVIKFGASAGVLSEEESVGAPQYTQEEMNAIVDEAKMWGRKACAHAHGTEAIKMAIKSGVASVEHGSILDDECIQLMKQKGTYYDPTIFVGDYVLQEFAKKGYPEKIMNKARLISPLVAGSFTKAVKAGVKISFGTDAGVFPHGLNARQFAYMVKYGQTPIQAIQSATVNSADLLGWSKKVGSIEKGKFADIIAVEGNPLDNIRILENVSFVMKGGVVYKNELKNNPANKN
jgi:imidazolonepropionase-like amidohydrolase